MVLLECGRILDLSKKSFIIVYPNIFFYQLFVVFTCCSRLCLYMCLTLCVCAAMHGCTVICELW